MRRAARCAGGLVGLYVLMAAGCPFRQSDRSPGEAAWSEEVFLRVGDEASVDAGALSVALIALDPGSRIAEVTLRLTLAGAGDSVVETVDAVRNAQHSEAVRLGGYTARVRGFPGVDSATLVVAREQHE
ncbi:MAG TPA: hypothetical protein VM737_03980 [Gemmatimonadota bacterium]|nr:hypothetical protein [Gemmatimonadota bacterium]